MRERLKRLPAWIDKLWPWGPIVLVALAILTGIRSVAEQPPDSDTDQIADVVHDFGKDADNHRGEDACAWLTASGQRALVAEVPTVTCPVFVRSFGLGFDPRALGEANITAITVKGDTATIRRAELLNERAVSLGIALTLTKTPGGWKISAIRRA
jgi:hypothetical protein